MIKKTLNTNNNHYLTAKHNILSTEFSHLSDYGQCDGSLTILRACGNYYLYYHYCWLYLHRPSSRQKPALNCLVVTG